MKLELTLSWEADQMRAERDAWRRRAESTIRPSVPQARQIGRSARTLRFVAATFGVVVLVLTAGFLVERSGAGVPDYPGCIGKARYEHPIEGNQYQELVNALYACEVYASN